MAIHVLTFHLLVIWLTVFLLFLACLASWLNFRNILIFTGGCCGRMVVGFTTTCAISAYHH